MEKKKEDEAEAEEDDSMNLGCFMCDYQIKSKSDQKLHNRKHEEYICKVCGYNAKRLVCNLQRHFISKHPEGVLPVYRPKSELVMFVEGINEYEDYYENEEFVEEEAIDELEDTTVMPKFHSTMIKQQEISETAENEEDRFNEIIEYSNPKVQKTKRQTSIKPVEALEEVEEENTIVKTKSPGTQKGKRGKKASVKQEEVYDEEYIQEDFDEQEIEQESTIKVVKIKNKSPEAKKGKGGEKVQMKTEEVYEEEYVAEDFDNEEIEEENTIKVVKAKLPEVQKRKRGKKVAVRQEEPYDEEYVPEGFDDGELKTDEMAFYKEVHSEHYLKTCFFTFCDTGNSKMQKKSLTPVSYRILFFLYKTIFYSVNGVC